MNPTNFSCPSDIAAFVQTDYRPNKSLYVSIKRNNDYRDRMQRNGANIIAQNRQNYVNKMYCNCERRNTFAVPRFSYSKNVYRT